jgi:hypothetical protein
MSAPGHTVSPMVPEGSGTRSTGLLRGGPGRGSHPLRPRTGLFAGEQEKRPVTEVS